MLASNIVLPEPRVPSATTSNVGRSVCAGPDPGAGTVVRADR